jgi:hypothetical protein
MTPEDRAIRNLGVLGELPVSGELVHAPGVDVPPVVDARGSTKPARNPQQQLNLDLKEAAARDTTLERVARRLKAHPSVANIWESALSLVPMSDRAESVGRLLLELLTVLETDPFGAPTEENRFASWITKTETEVKRDQLRKVATAARDLAKGLRDCAGTDQLTVEVFGLKDRYELPRLLEVLAERAANRRCSHGLLKRPKGAKWTYWFRMLDQVLGRGRITDTERNEVIAKLTEAMLGCPDIDPTKVRNSTKKPRKSRRLSRSP